MGSENDLLDLSQWIEGQLTREPFQVDDLDEVPRLIAVYGPWGCGKSTALRHWATTGSAKGRVATYRADNCDHEDNPLSSLVASILPLLPAPNRSVVAGIALKAVKAAAPAILRALVPALISKLTNLSREEMNELLALVGVQEASKGASEAAVDAVFAKTEGYENAVTDLRAHIQMARVEPEPIVLVIDELDRCRPEFALQVIELARNLASPKLKIVLCLNRHQMEHYLASTSKIAGQEAVAGYLSKYVRSWYPFTGEQIRKSFLRQQAGNTNWQSTLDRPLVVEVCVHIAISYNLQLRPAIRVFEKLGLVDNPTIGDLIIACLQEVFPLEYDMFLRGGEAERTTVRDSVRQRLHPVPQLVRESVYRLFEPTSEAEGEQGMEDLEVTFKNLRESPELIRLVPNVVRMRRAEQRVADAEPLAESE